MQLADLQVCHKVERAGWLFFPARLWSLKHRSQSTESISSGVSRVALGSYLTSLCLSFFISKIEIGRTLTSHVRLED